ncbi:hypothetical protein [Stutzerimonas stutzeri]|uniref:hypothetical protein n=1 Tax=Stutzerimonas stutzeri TaxID=316 RepID=UPI001C2E6F16|nr:hypothetical protein [Stutzerimonas stutzeri]
MEVEELTAHDSYFDQEGNPLRLCFERCAFLCSGVKVILNELPYLICDATGEIFFPWASVEIIKTEVMHAIDRQKGSVTINQVGRFNRGKLPVAGSTKFKYSPIEHFFIPGLVSRIPSDGYLTPVYFNKDVLIKFRHSENCELREYTPTAGLIKTKYGMSVPYGVNSSGNIVMWLGDVVRLSEQERQYLYSENIDPQYDLHSDFYRSQIMNEWLA